MVPGRESPNNTDDALMVSLESDSTDVDVDNTYISLHDSELTLEQSCFDSSRCSAALEVQPSRPVSPSSSGSMAPTPTAESTVIESTPVGQMNDIDIGMLNNETPFHRTGPYHCAEGPSRISYCFPP